MDIIEPSAGGTCLTPTKAKQIQTDNGYRIRWNYEVDRAIISGVAETPVRQLPKKETQTKPKIPQKPVMPAEAAAYPKLFKIYKELKRQNKAIFEAEKERNTLEFERDDLKGLARFTKKGELPLFLQVIHAESFLHVPRTRHLNIFHSKATEQTF